MKFTRHQWNSFLHYCEIAGYGLTIAALPLSNLFMSVGMIVLAVVCTLQFISSPTKQEFITRLNRFTKAPWAILLSGIYILVVAGMIWTTETSHGAWDLQMKLPILVLPFILLTLDPLSEYIVRVLKGIFILSLTFAVGVCLLVYFHIIPIDYNDVRDISIFISHIRFSLLLVIGLIIAWHETWDRGAKGKTFCLILTSGFFFFLFVLESLTGLTAIACVVVWWLMMQLLQQKSRIVKLLSFGALIAIPILSGAYLVHCYKEFFTVAPLDWKSLPSKTAEGDTYDHNVEYPMIEEGHFVYTYIAWGELYSGWKEKSAMSLDSLDRQGRSLKGTLIRYLASLDLKKDHAGIKSLSDDDIRKIESGETTAVSQNKNPVRKRIDRVLFEYSNFRAGGSANGHSVFQRLEFWRASWGIIRNNFWYGVGTGDTKIAFAQQYEAMHSSLDKEHRLRAHNQYLTMWLTYGIIGLLYFIFAITWSLLKGGWKDRLYAPFMIILLLSFCSEDTLETQAGVMLFIFFSIFLHPAFRKTLARS